MVLAGTGLGNELGAQRTRGLNPSHATRSNSSEDGEEEVVRVAQGIYICMIYIYIYIYKYKKKKKRKYCCAQLRSCAMIHPRGVLRLVCRMWGVWCRVQGVGCRV